MDQKPEAIRDYRDLIVWKEAMDIAEHVYLLKRSFPREELFGMTSQMRRGAISIPANIADGFGRAQTRSFIQFLRIAQGSLEAPCTILGKWLVAFVRSLEQGGKLI